MANLTLTAVSGMIQSITPLINDCCTLLINVVNSEGITGFTVDSSTYVIQEARLRVGMQVTAFYDAAAAIPQIYPPQYQAIIIGRRNSNETIYAGYFNDDLIAEDQSLRLNIAPSTEILTSNGQRYTCNLGGQLLIVYYSVATLSLPPQTTPRRIIVMC